MVNAVDFRFIIDNQALQDLLTGISGPVYEYTLKRSIILQTAAKNQIPLGTQEKSGDSARGHLRDSVVKRIMPNPGGSRVLIEVWVGSDHPRALLHHEGSKAHIITPKTASVLRFQAFGKTVFAMSVNHPGTKPNRYLTDNIHLIKD